MDQYLCSTGVGGGQTSGSIPVLNRGQRRMQHIWINTCAQLGSEVARRLDQYLCSTGVGGGQTSGSIPVLNRGGGRRPDVWINTCVQQG